MEPPHKNIKVSVIVVNWNRKQHLEECLGSLSKQTFKDFKTMLVDNGSTDGSIEFVETNFPAVKIVRLDKNEGFCRGNNIDEFVKSRIHQVLGVKFYVLG